MAASSKRQASSLDGPPGQSSQVVRWVIRSFTSDFAMVDRDDLFCFYMADRAGCACRGL